MSPEDLVERQIHEESYICRQINQLMQIQYELQSGGYELFDPNLSKIVELALRYRTQHLRACQEKYNRLWEERGRCV